MKKFESIGYATVKDFPKGSYIKLTNNKSKKVYIRGDYDRFSKKYNLIDVNDVLGNGRYVKGSTPANDDFVF